MPPLHLAVILAAGWATAGLALQYWRARSFGRRRLFAPPAGDARRGVRYAFTGGMAPRAKESVMAHLPTYLAGILYHVGVFVALFLLVLDLLGLRLPPAALWPAGLALSTASLAGLGLLAKRLADRYLRGLSTLDDYLANLLTTGFVIAALTAALLPPAADVWRLVAILLFAYAPLGKIRHCLFFFPSRAHFGAFFGRRGTFPPTADRA